MADITVYAAGFCMGFMMRPLLIAIRDLVREMVKNARATGKE